MMTIKSVIIAALFVGLPCVAHASVLNGAQFNRVKAAQMLLDGADERTLKQTCAQFEKTTDPSSQIAIFETEAKAFADIVQEQHVISSSKRRWLYSKVQLNMAYLQLSGINNKIEDHGLNQLIQTKLLVYLPDELRHSRLFHPLD